MMKIKLKCKCGEYVEAEITEYDFPVAYRGYFPFPLSTKSSTCIYCYKPLDQCPGHVTCSTQQVKP